MIPNLQRFLFRFVLLFWGLLSIIYAQPSYLQTDISGAYNYYSLSDLGNFRQYTVTASGTHNNEWAFLTNNNYGSCPAPNCAVWRHYNAGGSQMPFNTVIQPNGSANYGALYNDNVNSSANGQASFTQATTNGKSYTFNFYENGAANSYFTILETNYFPTNLTGTPSMNSGGTVSVSGLPTLATGEYLYCRYSSDNFVTSNIADVSIVGTNGTAQIPPFSSGTNTQFYLYSSNMSSSYILSQAASFGEKAHDLFTLRILVPAVGSTYSGTFGGPVIVKGTTGTNNSAIVYSTLKAAFDAINLNTTHQGIINVWINGNTSETATASLTTTSPSSITIQPSGGAARTVSGTLTTPLLNFDNTDNVTIDGLNANGNSLTFENTSNTSGSTALTLTNGVTNYLINKCTFKGSTTNATTGAVIYLNNTTGINNNITLQNSKVTRSGTSAPVNAILVGASTAGTGTNSNINFLNNEIYDFSTSGSANTAGIRIQTNTNTVNIIGNHFYNTSSMTFTSSADWSGIVCSSATSYGINITNNYIGGSAINATGSLALNTARLQAIRLTVGTTLSSTINGNTIRNISVSATGASNLHGAISLVTGKFKCGNLSGNNIEDIVFYSSATTGNPQLSGIVAGSGTLDTCVIMNNKIRRMSIVVSGTNTGNRLSGIFAFVGTTGVYNLSNNEIGDTTVSSNGLSINLGEVMGFDMNINNSSIHLLKNNIIANLSTQSGVFEGIYLRGGTGNDTIKNNIIRANTCTTTGYGIRISVGSNYHVVDGNIIRNNTAGTTFTGINYGSVNLSYTIQNNNIYANTSASTNYGIQGTGGTTTTSSHIINNNTIRDNTGSTCAGIFISSSAIPYTINNNTIYNLISTSSSTFGISSTFSGVATHNINGNIIRNITGASTSGNVTGIIVSASNATLNISSNNVHHLLSSSGTLSGISLNYTTTTTATNNINNNTVAYLTGTNTASSSSNVVGIGVNSSTACNISNNIVRGINAANSIIFNPAALAFVPSLIGISVSGSGSPMLASQNNIFGLSTTNNTSSPSVAGITWTSTAASGTIEKNFIHSLNVSSSITTNSAIVGIVNYCTSNGVTTRNNMIRLGLDSLGNSITTAHSFAGIADFSGTNAHYFNSIYIGGSGVGTGASSTCFSGALNNITLRNNIFQNARSSSVSGTPCHYGVSGSNTSAWSSNYNAFYVTGTNGIMAYMNNPLAPPAVSYTNFCDWRSLTTQDNNSIWGNPNFIAPTGDATSVNLHLNTPTVVEGKGISIASISTDYDNDTRNSNPDIGADEGTFIYNNLTISAGMSNPTTIPAFCKGASSFDIPYGTITGGATLYSVTDVGGNATGFSPITDATISGSPITVNIPTNLPAGTYQFALIFKNPIYCITKGYIIDVTIEDYPSLIITNPASVCAPASIDITTSSTIAGSTLSGGTNISYWANSSATNPIPASNGSASALTVGGTYYIMASTAAGCSDIRAVVVDIQTQPNLVITNPSAVCAPTTVNLTLSSVTSGSSLTGATLSYWTNASATNTLASPNAVSASATYYIKAATTAGCNDIKPVVVDIQTQPNLVITNPSAVCAPTSIDLTLASVTSGSSLTGATLSYWTNASATNTLASPNAVSTSGTYYIKAATTAGCNDIKPVVVDIQTQPNLVITNPNAVCAPTTVNLTLSSVTSGSSLTGATLSYWTNASATNALVSPNAVSASGTYYIKAVTTAGCNDIKPVVTTVNSSPALAPNATDKCIYANSTTLTASANGTGSLVWYNNNSHSGTPLGSGTTLSITTSATYYVFETQNGCFSPAKAVVANVRPNISTNVPASPGDYWATDAINSGTWTHFCDCPNDLLLVSLELGGQNIGTNLVSNSVTVGNSANEYGVKVHVIGGNSVHIPISVPYVNSTLNPQGWWVFPRTWDVFPHTQPTSPVGVRYYYTPTDFNNLNIDISLAGLGMIPNEGSMSFYKLLSTNASNALDNNHVGISANQIAVYYNDTYHPNWLQGNLAPLAANTHYAEYDVTSFSGGGGGGGGAGMPPLPLRLKYFRGTKIETKHQLSWGTEMESNLSHFEIERGIDNISFEKIGTKKAAGYSQSEQSYLFNDTQPYIGKNVYRLKMVDNDGQFTYSNEIELFNMANFGYSIYPNPAEDKIFLSISDASEKIVFSLYDITGKQVFSQKYEGSVHLLEEITTQTFSRGVYVYKIVHDGEAFQGRIILK